MQKKQSIVVNLKARAVRSNGIQVFKISGKEKPVEITIKDGEGLKSGYFIVNKSNMKY